MRTLGALTPRGFPRLHRSPGQLDDAGYILLYISMYKPLYSHIPIYILYVYSHDLHSIIITMIIYTGYKVSYSFSEDMYYKSRKLTFSPVKPIGSSPEKNNKYLKNQYIAPVILEEPPPDISKTCLQEQV